MAKSLREAALERHGLNQIDDTDLMRQAFKDKLAGKTNETSDAMKEIIRRYKL